MTLKELAVEYRLQERQLQARVQQLKKLLPTCSQQQQISLQTRINHLITLQREAREIATLLEHYYERGYYKRGKYAL